MYNWETAVTEKKSWSKGTNWTAAGGVTQQNGALERKKRKGESNALLILWGTRVALIGQNSRQKWMLVRFLFF